MTQTCAHGVDLAEYCSRCSDGRLKTLAPDLINSPPHYKAANGLESIDVIEAFDLHHSFNLGNVIKYILRRGKKGDPLSDLKKARWYLDREIITLEKEFHK